MYLYLNDLIPKPEPTDEAEVVELRLVGAFYTYCGWFPWSDFEGESFSEEKVYELTGGQSGLPTADPAAVRADELQIEEQFRMR